MQAKAIRTILRAACTVFCAGFTLVSPGAWGATATTSMSISATVLSYCTVAALPMAFGNYGSTQLDASSSLSVTCSSGTSYSVALDQGVGVGASVASRRMTGALGSELTYSLYTDSARTSVWGNTTGTNTLSSTGTGIAQTLTVYGRIPASQFPPPGAFTDTVSVVLTY